MPKGAIHHIHLTAACPVDFLIELTYDPIVYFNERDGMFKVSKTGSPGAGFINCNEMRNFKPTAEEFDNYLKNQILLTKEEMSSQESQLVWELFQNKFLLTNDLYNYAPFFERVIMRVF